MIWHLLAGIIFTATFRIVRGGGVNLGLGTHVSRALWAAPSAAAFAFAVGDPWVGVLALSLFVGVIFGWGSYQDIGTMPGLDNESIKPLVAAIVKMLGDPPDGSAKYDFIGMTARGVLLGAPSIPALYLIGYDAAPLMLATGAMGLVYKLAISNGLSLKVKFLREPTEVAEVLIALIMAIAVAAVLVIGRT
jgi:hypothetical protein